MSITCYLGSMFSGKSSQVINEIERYNIAEIKTLMVKYLNDNRYSSQNEIVTHGQRVYSEKNGLIKSTNDLFTLDKYIYDSKIAVVGIDEFQFYSHPEYVTKWASSGIKIILSALDGDYKSEIFENVAYIIPKCDRIKKLLAVCDKCKKNAIATRRINANTKRILIGGKESYVALCRKCASWE